MWSSGTSGVTVRVRVRVRVGVRVRVSLESGLRLGVRVIGSEGVHRQVCAAPSLVRYWSAHAAMTDIRFGFLPG